MYGTMKYVSCEIYLKNPKLASNFCLLLSCFHLVLPIQSMTPISLSEWFFMQINLNVLDRTGNLNTSFQTYRMVSIFAFKKLKKLLNCWWFNHFSFNSLSCCPAPQVALRYIQQEKPGIILQCLTFWQPCLSLIFIPHISWNQKIQSK